MTLDEIKALPQPIARLVQLGLGNLGYDTGGTAGLPGPRTYAAFNQYLADQYGEPARVDLAETVARIAEGEIGVREQPMNSNRGKRVEEYQAATWLDGSGWLWCAAFVCWVIAKSGKLPFNRPRTAGAWDFENWAKDEKLDILFNPVTDIRRGDILIYTFSHIGIATSAPLSGVVRTVEGNTDAAGSREGGGVYAKTRKLSQIRSRIRL